MIYLLTILLENFDHSLLKSIVTSKPVPEEIEPFNIPIRKIKIKNLILWTKLSFLLPDVKPKFGLRNE